MAKDEMEWAWFTCMRAAGDDINAFIGARRRRSVSRKDLLRAGAIMVKYAKAQGNVWVCPSFG